MRLSSPLSREATLYLVWLLLILSVAMISLFCWRGLTSVRASAPAEQPDPRRISQSFRRTAAFEASGPGLGMDAGATTSSTDVVFLPLIRSGYWEAPDSLLGIQVGADHREQEAVAKAAQMGARWTRVPLPWNQIEPVNTTPEHYQWPAWFDDWLRRLSASNIRAIVTLYANPSWASTYPGGPLDLVEISELVEFMAAAVAHYSVPPYDVKYWEFYNEPDNTSEFYAENGWGFWGNEPAAYAAMLAAVYQPMKGADPEAQIVLGGLAYDWWTDDGGPFAKEFLDGVLQNGGGNSFDVMNFHYFPAFRSNWDQYGPGIIGKANRLRDKLASYGLDKPLLCTEAGMWSDALHGGSDELQSRYVPQVFVRSVAADLKATIWLRLVDDAALGSWKRGLLNPDLSPKPAYVAYQTLARQLAGADTGSTRTLGLSETGSDQIEAYEFAARDGATKIVVVWTEDGKEHPMSLAATQAIVVDKFGDQTTIYDWSDGVNDDRVWVTISPDPVYLHLSP